MVLSLKKICALWCLALCGLSAIAFAESEVCPDGMVLQSVQYEGLIHTNRHVVLRELSNGIGKVYTAKKFEEEKRRLLDLDLFTDITVTCDTSISRLTYHFKEIFRWLPAPAGKKTDRDGLMLGLAIANLNVYGEDIRAEVQYRTTVDPFFEKNEYALYMSSPYLVDLPLGWNVEVLATNSYDNIRDYQENSLLFDLDFDYRFFSHVSFLWTIAVRDLYYAALLPEAGLGFAFDYRDSKLDTRNGVYLEYMLTHVGVGDTHDSGCVVGVEPCYDWGGEKYWEILTDMRAYFSLWRFVTGATALVRYRPGEVKFYDYFYHGGANTFRGHEASSDYLGVHEALLTLEERIVLMERHAASIWDVNFFYGIQLVAGIDGSVLWNEGSPKWKDLETAVYGGIHLVIPALDRLRFEVGYSPEKGEPIFFFGLFDKVSSSRWRSR